MKKEVRNLMNRNAKRRISSKSIFNFVKSPMQKCGIAAALKSNSRGIFMFVLFLLLSAIVFADGWTSSEPSHQTLYADTITSRTDSSPVSIADSQGLYVTGNVGIGTTSPAGRLHIKDNNPVLVFSDDDPNADTSTIRITPQDSGTVAEIVFDHLTSGGNTDIDFKTHDGTSLDTRMSIIANGNVGIGTTGPAQKLDVAGTVQMTGFKMPTGASSSYVLTSDASGVGTWQAAAGGGGGGGGGWVDDGTVVRLDTSTDNVGIGTTSPGALLHLAKEDAVTNAVTTLQTLTHTTTGTAALGFGSGIKFQLEKSDGTLDTDAGGIEVAWSGAVNNANLYFRTMGARVGKMTESGQLRVFGNAPGIFGQASDTGGTYFQIFPWFTFTALLINHQGSGKLMQLQDGGVDKFVIDNSGNVGIGTASTANILTVVQDSATDPIADAWTTYSSRRWKTNITKLENAMEKVLKLDGVSFNWKADGRHDIGLIAEDVGKIVPEAAAYEDNNADAKGLDYNKFVPLLIESVKELNAKTERLEEENSKLESENMKLKARLTNLEYKIGKV